MNIQEIRDKISTVVQQYAVKPSRELADEHARLRLDLDLAHATAAEQCRLDKLADIRGKAEQLKDLLQQRVTYQEDISAMGERIQMAQAKVQELNSEQRRLNAAQHNVNKQIQSLELFCGRHGVDFDNPATWEQLAAAAAKQYREQNNEQNYS